MGWSEDPAKPLEFSSSFVFLSRPGAAARGNQPAVIATGRIPFLGQVRTDYGLHARFPRTCM
jgi:hypothetical protein